MDMIRHNDERMNMDMGKFFFPILKSLADGFSGVAKLSLNFFIANCHLREIRYNRILYYCYEIRADAPIVVKMRSPAAVVFY